MENKDYFILSLCAKAGKITAGNETVEKSIKNGSAKLVIVADDASENTKKKFIDKSKFYKTDCMIVSSKEELSHYTGKYGKAVFAVEDEGFASAIKKKLLGGG